MIVSVFVNLILTIKDAFKREKCNLIFISHSLPGKILSRPVSPGPAGSVSAIDYQLCLIREKPVNY